MNSERLPIEPASLALQEAIQDFLLHQKASRHSPRTLENHILALGKLKAWADAEGLSTLDDLTTSHLRRFIVHVQEAPTWKGTPPRPTTVHTLHKNIGAFMHFHEEEGNLPRSPMRRIKPPKLDQELLPAFTAEELKGLEAGTNGTDLRSVRNRALVYFMVDTGCRLAEAANMALDDVDLSTGMVKVRRGKGGKDRMTRLGFKALKALTKYLRSRRDLLPCLWVGKYGTMTADGIAITLVKLGQVCGVHCTAHKFRRTTALTMLRNGCDVFSIKALLGHSDLQVLQRYLAQTEADIAKAHERFGVLDHL